MRKQKTFILQLSKDDPKKELKLEVAFQLSLTEKQRYKRRMNLFKKTMAFVKNMTIRKLVQSLADHRIKFVIVGASALPAYRYSRNTFDIDIFLKLQKPMLLA